MESTLKEMLSSIEKDQKQVARSAKDENRVMKAMLTDTSYAVDIYDNNGVVDQYCPAKDFQNMCASVITSVAKVPAAEAASMMENYEVKTKEAASMLNISKEFINAYMQTGRKLSLGGRENSDISLSGKHIPATTRLFPQKVGVNSDGTARYAKTPTNVPAHDSIRVHAPCPSWVK